MTVYGMLQLSSVTPGGDCLEVSLDHENLAKLESRKWPVRISATITTEAPFGSKPHQTPATPHCFKLKSSPISDPGFYIDGLLTEGPYKSKNVVEFEILRANERLHIKT